LPLREPRTRKGRARGGAGLSSRPAVESARPEGVARAGGRARLMASPSGSGTALPWANTAAPVRAGVPSLSDMCLDTLAAHADGLTSIQGVDIHLCTGLLYRIMQSRRCGSNTGLTSPASCSRFTFLLPTAGGTLSFKLALVFRDCGHPDIADAVRSLDLLAAIPTHNAIPKR
jgi:hypothetical protein